MEEANAPEPPIRKRGTIILQPGQPLQFTDEIDAEASNISWGPVGAAISATLRAYKRATIKLLEGRYASQRELAPIHMREPCNVLVLHCDDGILVRYDLALQELPKLRFATSEKNLREMSPQFSEQVIHFPQDPKNYDPGPGGVELIMQTTDPVTSVTKPFLHIRPVIYATTALPNGFEIPPPPARPICLAALQNELDIQIQGLLQPVDSSSVPPEVQAEQFIAHSRFRLPVGWQTIEIYPPLGPEYWKPEYAPMWAELDLLAAIAQKNAFSAILKGLDGRGATRKHYAALLEEFEGLLEGPEEPAHQFLKKHPELLCPTHEKCWSKLAFGDRVSDFVFREPHNEYLLVEIEAPVREMFRRDGQQREELTHAINQIADWVQYITDNKQQVEEHLGLTGISASPRSLVVIGRSASLTEENRRKIVTLQEQQAKLRILTYDDLIASAKANLNRILGPLELRGQNVDFYFYKTSVGK
jgi:hypothetical protein